MNAEHAVVVGCVHDEAAPVAHRAPLVDRSRAEDLEGVHTGTRIDDLHGGDDWVRHGHEVTPAALR